MTYQVQGDKAQTPKNDAYADLCYSTGDGDHKRDVIKRERLFLFIKIEIVGSN